jgi:hypothetical protein
MALTEVGHKAALARIEALMDAKVGTPEGDELDALTDLVVCYEFRADTVDNAIASTGGDSPCSNEVVHEGKSRKNRPRFLRLREVCDPVLLLRAGSTYLSGGASQMTCAAHAQ